MTKRAARSCIRALVLVAAFTLPSACAYDPRTGTYVPCCVYPYYGYYSYPTYYGYPGYSYGGWYYH